MKKVHKIIGVLFFTLFFCGCAKEELMVEEVIEILPTDISIIEYDNENYMGEMTSFEIIERNTNKLKGEDNIKGSAVIVNEYFECIKNVDIYMEYEKDNWLIKSYDETKSINVIMKPPISEKEILKTLPEDITQVTIGDMDIVLEMTSFEIEKRQTDVNAKTDTAWCVVTLSNEFYEFVKYITLTYSYYDVKGGWLLDSCWEDNARMEYKVIKNPFSESEIYDLMRNEIPYAPYDTYILKECVEELENNRIIYTYEASAEYEYKKTKSEYIYSCSFNGYQWMQDIQQGDSSEEWDIVGVYYVEEKDTNIGFCMTISEYDSINQRVYGWCSFEYNRPATFSHYSDYYEMNGAQVEITNSEMKISLDNTGIAYEETYLFFNAIRAYASYNRWWSRDIYRQ